jgi:hypothetical protein
VIPAEAVEAAAKALYVLENQGRSACPFDSLPQSELNARIEMAQAALDAAAPYLLEPAYEQGWEDGREGTRRAVWWQK